MSRIATAALLLTAVAVAGLTVALPVVAAFSKLGSADATA
jgi:hypothetical protein